MSKTLDSENQMKSVEIYEKIADYVSKRNHNYTILEYYLNLGIINKNSSPDILNKIFKSKDLVNKYHPPLKTVKLPENLSTKTQNTNDYEPTYEEIENHSFGFIEPQIKYSYIVYLLNEIHKHDEFYYIAFYELSKHIKFDPKYILNFVNSQAYNIIKRDAKRELYLSYKSSPELLSWRYWMRIFQADQN
ncbi:hypothetical protein TVAG_139120 [Trichomonas vaginalis G3]|uniref:Uncharacterized protein n=1 Tax=Trichomonas vaginalis (strain ATCC PRA-98 / G3) TaxID=412133 RepID=A2E486_TRIV3|nr:hypothetical protein TVAGG3_0251980 [Trichomonas vaginalis G3]EAY12532.1 hypothetical protein TVAG_139120 [Trichomonas vaginalis G3]KAI5554070.1 hypothetical protein TVAGG3_0251980 [Trichomonas vaginalis G3]|eukprot:XP_001324755.1 hypothetical protein [Trichomonas vaginalis G3]